jgi:hypothetical protein
VLLLAAYLLLVPPAFMLGPLAGLLLLSHPRTAREWVWIVVAAGASLLWVQQPGTLAGQVVRTAAVQLTGAYLALTLWRPAPGWNRALQAAGVGGAGLALLMARTGVRWGELHAAVADGLRGSNWFRLVERLLPPGSRAAAAAVAAHVADLLATLFPVLLAVIGIAGVQLAWAWHCRLAERPIGERFCTGEFNL